MSQIKTEEKSCKLNIFSHPHQQLSRKEQLKIRILQKNTAFIFGLPALICNEMTLSSYQWFGQFGQIVKIIIGNSTETDSAWTNITFSNPISALRAINYINNEYTFTDGRVCKATFGYKRYCQFWLNRICTNKTCDYLHSWCNKDELNNVVTNDMTKRFHSTPGGQRTVNNKYWKNKFGKTSRELTEVTKNRNNMFKQINTFPLSETINAKSFIPMAMSETISAKPFIPMTIPNNMPIQIGMNDQHLISVQRQQINELMSKLQQTQTQLINTKHSYNKLELKYNSLKTKYCCLDMKYQYLQIQKTEIKEKDNYLRWDAHNIYNWIISINDGYFTKYNGLHKNLNNERIDGKCLGKLDKTDLHRLGVTNFNDKVILMEKIQELVGLPNDNSYVEGLTETK